MTLPRFVLAGVAICLTTPVTAQRPTYGSGMHPHQVEQLWPQRELSPIEAELKNRVVVLRDTLYNVDAQIEQVDRFRTSGRSGAALRSALRILASRCSELKRESEVMQIFANDLSTSDERFGEPAVRRMRDAVRKLSASATECSSNAVATRELSEINAERLGVQLRATRDVLRTYEAAASGLLKTLNIDLDARGHRPPLTN